MPLDWNVVMPSLVSAVSGLCGVWLGGQLTFKREARREADRIKRESNYLVILVVAHLDRFIDGCVQVSFDNGMSEGRPAGEDGVCAATVTVPSFDPLVLTVDWKVLPADLMYEILNLPYRAEQLAGYISSIAEYDDPPDFDRTFWARQLGYAELGLEISKLARRLRQHANLPVDQPVLGNWDREKTLREQVAKVTAEKAAYEAGTITFSPVAD
ncbi:hypothetical protein Bpet4629 [Bordetella petrii]|uniref:Uncharacterized protein n=2 Tax=Bordetella petrii TaxID=94624 RepID=A9IF71_BORPD|nr:hypothetical protein Bpet4629 [Bordetella petrii]